MKCPACDRNLKKMNVGELEVDVCENGCGGIWFDNFELKKIDEKHEAAGIALLDIPIDEKTKLDDSKTRLCPKCDNQKLSRHFFTVKREVEIDECVVCGGIWLDCGELRLIRDQFETEEARRNAAQHYIGQIFNEDLANAAAKSEQQVGRAKKFARALRLICPTYYIPGKQDWGSF